MINLGFLFFGVCSKSEKEAKLRTSMVGPGSENSIFYIGSSQSVLGSVHSIIIALVYILQRIP